MYPFRVTAIGQRFLTALVIGAGLSWAASAPAGDDLFSEITTESVFDDLNKNSGLDSPAATNTTRVAGASKLIKLLEEQGFEAKRLNARAVSATVSAEKWKIPTRLAVAVDDDRIEIALLLSKVQDESQLKSSDLLELMNLSRNPIAGVFVYNAEQSRIELRRFISNLNLTSGQLQNHLNELAQMAGSSVTAWNLEEGEKTESDAGSEASDQQQPARSNTTKKETPANINLQGTWTATRASGEAVALQINAGNTFVLAIVGKSGSTRSTGQAEIDSTKLSLRGSDGSTLTGQLLSVTETTFEYQIQGQSALKFSKTTGAN